MSHRLAALPDAVSVGHGGGHLQPAILHAQARQGRARQRVVGLAACPALETRQATHPAALLRTNRLAMRALTGAVGMLFQSADHDRQIISGVQ